MNTSIQLCSAAILISLLILQVKKRRISLRSQKVFQYILLDDLIICFLKMFFIIRTNMKNGIPGPAELAADKAATVFMIILLLLSYFYYIMGLFKRFKTVRQAFQFNAVLTALSAAVVILLPVNYGISDYGTVYAFGSSIHIFGFISMLLLTVSLIAIVNHRRYADRRKLSVFSMWLLMWIISFALQYGLNIQVHEFFVAIGIVVIFIKAENPESYIDIDSGVFNEQFLQAYVSHYYEKFGNFSMLVISPWQIGYIVGNVYNVDDSNIKRTHLVMKEIIRYADHNFDSIVFRHGNNNITMLFQNRKQMESASADIMKRLSEEWFFDRFSAVVRSSVFEIPDCKSIAKEEELIETVRYFVKESTSQSALRRFVLNDEWLEKMKSDSDMVNTIKEAIEYDRIEVFYQPIYSTVKKRIVSAEALLRIRDAGGKLIMPGDFIPIAEKNGMIIDLGKIVFRKACSFIIDNDLAEKGINYLEINLSAIQCVEEELADQYIEIMENLEVDPSMINLEITESAALGSKEILMQNMQKLIDYGVEFSLDDFGTGYSNLNYIMELPVSIVKFDKQMTNSYFESRKGKLVMEAAIGMIKAVGTKIVSEGVETKDQLDELEKACIDYIQGYYFSKPVSGEEFIRLLKEKNNGYENSTNGSV